MPIRSGQKVVDPLGPAQGEHGESQADPSAYRSADGT
jgi:hypothetical protein